MRSVTATATSEETKSEHFSFTPRKAISCSIAGGNEI